MQRSTPPDASAAGSSSESDPQTRSSYFPHIGGRRAQRAYFDAVRDLVAPSFGWRVKLVMRVRFPPPA